ncbi:MAG: DUF1538 domain-containing protein [Myxococcota bacterium]|jgi:hypothetical protein|nr:DUF1538 domain-containing protein [Myxococcota bacterium]
MAQDSGTVKISGRQAMQILGGYTGHQLLEQVIIVIPVVAYLVFVQLVLLRWTLEHAMLISAGIALVILGLMFFMEGVKVALLPLGEVIGRILPQRKKMGSVLVFSFLIGLLAAYGEPVIGSLQIAGAGVDPQKAPLLYTLLQGRPLLLVGCVTVGVGIAFVIGMLRYVKGWSIKPFVLSLVAIASALSVLAIQNEATAEAMGLAWDTGAVIAGPVSTPLVLALGMGIYQISGRANTGLAGFGSVGLMSLFPIVLVLILLFACSAFLDVESIAAAGGAASHAQVQSLGTLAVDSVLNAARAILPILFFLWLSLRLWLKESEEGIPLSHFALAMAFAVIGLFMFNYGLSIGLSELGNQVGHRLPHTFHPPDESLYGGFFGKLVVVLFGGILGYGATLAEPAFNTLGQQVEDVTQGAFKKWLFGQAVALGVGIGAALGMASLVFGWSLIALLLPPYALLFVLTLLSDEKYNSIAWDGGAVTTGPVTVPLKIAIGIALSHATGFAEGFGVLALASAYPVMNILLLGLYVRHREHTKEALTP